MWNRSYFIPNTRVWPPYINVMLDLLYYPPLITTEWGTAGHAGEVRSSRAVAIAQLWGW